MLAFSSTWVVGTRLLLCPSAMDALSPERLVPSGCSAMRALLLPTLIASLPLKGTFSLLMSGQRTQVLAASLWCLHSVSCLMVTSLTLPRNLGKTWPPSSRTSIPRGRGTCSGKQTGEARAWVSGQALGSWNILLCLLLRGVESCHAPPLPLPFRPPLWTPPSCVPDDMHQSSTEVRLGLNSGNARCLASSRLFFL